MEKRIGPVTLEYVEVPDGVDLVVSYRPGVGGSWTGIASFPWSLEDEALSWAERIHGPTDVEDLLRQWAPADTWGSFQDLRNEIGV